MTLERVLKILFREMEQQGISQRQMQRICGVNAAEISSWKTGKRNPNLTSLCTVMDALGLELGIRRKKPAEERMEANV